MFSENDTMKMYMQYISQYPLISPEKEIELAKQIKEGSESAKIQLIRSNLRLVVKIAHDFKGLGVPLLDLISEGNLGLMRAVEKFDPSKGAKLSSYAAWWIKQAMRRSLANHSRTIRVPIQSASKMNRIHSARVRLRETLDREPSHAEIAETVNLTERTVAGLKMGKVTTISLNDPISQGEESEIKDVLSDDSTSAPDESMEDAETYKRMMELICYLGEREKHILRLRFGLFGESPHTLDSVSSIVGLTRERIRQIQNHALRKLRLMLDEVPVEDNQEVSAVA